MDLRITTFNMQNLFNRYAFLDQPWENRKYESLVTATGVTSIASRKGDLVPYATTEIQRNNTAQAILDSKPDILAVQEVENIYTLRIFNDEFLDDYFDRIILLDGNDPRGIDVGLMIREGADVEVLGIRTNVDLAKEGKRIRRTTGSNIKYYTSGAVFSRDCLEVDILANGKVLTFLVNHLKAQDWGTTHVGRRKLQADTVWELCENAVGEKRLPIVLGDLNMDHDAPLVDEDNSLDSLFANEVLVDPFASSTAESRWTHYYPSGRKTSRLDYLLLHKDLDVLSKTVLRNGLTKKCKQYEGDRYPTIGMKHTEASDHCPVTIEIRI